MDTIAADRQTALVFARQKRGPFVTLILLTDENRVPRHGTPGQFIDRTGGNGYND